MCPLSRLLTLAGVCFLWMQMASPLPASQTEISGALRTVLLSFVANRKTSPQQGPKKDILAVKEILQAYKDSVEVTYGSKNTIGLREDDSCVGGEVNGCSVPFGLPFFFKNRFTPSCNRHDVCYQCGIDFDIPKTTCDDTFREDMESSCDETYWATASLKQSISPNQQQPTSHLWKQRVLKAIRTERTAMKTVLIDFLSDWRVPGKASGLREFRQHVKSVQSEVLTRWALILLTHLHETDADIPVQKIFTSETVTGPRDEDNEIGVESNRGISVSESHNPSYFKSFEGGHNIQSSQGALLTSSMPFNGEDSSQCSHILAKVDQRISSEMSHRDQLFLL